MSIDSSLKTKGDLGGKRSVMTRAERLDVIKGDKLEKAKKGEALGLPKTKPTVT